MPTACASCGHVSRDGVDWCDGCGAQLEIVTRTAEPRRAPTAAVEPATEPATESAPEPEPCEPTAGEWRLVPKERGLLLKDRAIPLNGSRLLLGRFDASTGPVDIGISQLPGAETTSRPHAVLQYVGDGWTVGDVDSANGVFVRRAGEERFSARILDPTPVAAGDEIGLGMMLLLLLQGPANADQAAAGAPALIEHDSSQMSSAPTEPHAG